MRYSTTFRNRGAETDQWVFPGAGAGETTYFSLSKYICDFFLMLYFEITRFTRSCKKKEGESNQINKQIYQ